MHKENVALCVIAGAFVNEFGIVPGLDNDILLALSRHYIQELQRVLKGISSMNLPIALRRQL